MRSLLYDFVLGFWFGDIFSQKKRIVEEDEYKIPNKCGLLHMRYTATTLSYIIYYLHVTTTEDCKIK
jgi:hypothetical protein